MAISTGAAILGGSLISGGLGLWGSSQASKSSERAAKAGIGEQSRQYDTSRADLAPYKAAGTNALAQYQSGIQAPRDKFEFNLEGDKGYQFAVGEAERGVNRGAALGGKLGSGNRLAALSDRITGVASQYANDAYNRQYGESRENYGRDQNYLNRLWGVSEAGRGATGTGVAADQSYAGNVGNILSGDAANQANAAYTGAGAVNNAVQGGIGNYLAYNQNQEMLDAYNNNQQTSNSLLPYSPTLRGA